MEQERQTEISFKKLIDILLKHLIVILAVALVAAALGYAYSQYVATPTYRSTSKYSVNVESIGNTYSDYTLAMKDVNNCIEYLNVREFYAQVADAYDPDYTPEQIGAMLSFSTKAETTCFTITVAASSAKVSKDISDVISSLVPERIAKYKQDNQDYVMLLDGAITPTAPSSPNVNLNVFVCFIIGALLTYLVFFIKELADDRVKDVSELAERYEYPVLGAVPNFVNASESGKGGKK